MNKLKCKMRKARIDGESHLIISIQEMIKEDELFMMLDEVVCNCSPHTDELCKSKQEKLIASTDSFLEVHMINTEDIIWFGEQRANEIDVEVEIGSSSENIVIKKI